MNEKKRLYFYYNISLCVLLLTPIRALFVLIVPFLVLWFSRVYGVKVNCLKLIVFSSLFLLSAIWGVWMGSSPVVNILLSLWIVYPLLLLILGNGKVICGDIAKNFIDVASFILCCVDIVGILLGYFVGFHPDFMEMTYGAHFARMNGLAMINTVFSVYYLVNYLSVKSKISLAYFLLFSVSIILCQCGLVFICIVLTFVVIALLKSSVKYCFVLLVCMLISFLFARRYNTEFGYYSYTLSLLNEKNVWEDNFRKMKVFSNYEKVIRDAPANLLFGVGPGSYNGRVAFLINEDASNPFVSIFGTTSPKYHKKYVYPLWNKYFVSQTSYNDGSRNKPFSSCLSILAEYGVVMFVFVYGFYLKKILLLRKCSFRSKNFVLLFISIFWFLMLLCDQWLESSEMMFYLVFIYMLQSVIKGESYDVWKKKYIIKHFITSKIFMGESQIFAY